jgi:hypothetical protein
MYYTALRSQAVISSLRKVDELDATVRENQVCDISAIVVPRAVVAEGWGKGCQ